MAFIADAAELSAEMPLEQRANVLRWAREGIGQCARAWVGFAEREPWSADVTRKYLDRELVVKGDSAVRVSRAPRAAAGAVRGADAVVRADLLSKAADPYVTDADRTAARDALARLDGNR